MAQRKSAALTPEFLKKVIRSKGKYLLNKPNVTSVGIGYKISNGKRTDQLCIQVTVERKLSLEDLAEEKLVPLEKNISADDGTLVPIDVVQRSYKPTFEVVADPEAEALADQPSARQMRRSRLDKIVPGVSISHHNGTAGTLGAVVYDRNSGEPFALSNWHVLHRTGGQLGDLIVQPGVFDNSDTNENILGKLTRSHLGLAGDCAIGSIEGRSFDEEILELGVRPRRVAKGTLGDTVVKSGRTTGVTFGVIQRIEVVTKLNYGGDVGLQEIGGFEIGPDPQRPGPQGEVSMGGDSGSLWLVHENGRPTDIAVGLHFAGETDPDPQAEHAVACNIHSVLDKLNVSFVHAGEPPVDDENLLNDIMAILAAHGSRLKALEARLAEDRSTSTISESTDVATSPPTSDGTETSTAETRVRKITAVIRRGKRMWKRIGKQL